MASLPATARATTAPAIARNTVPWACDVAGCDSPSGLQNPHIDSSSDTGRPHRTHGCVGSGAGRPAGCATGAVEDGGAEGGIGASMVPRTRAEGRRRGARRPYAAAVLGFLRGPYRVGGIYSV